MDPDAAARAQNRVGLHVRCRGCAFWCVQVRESRKVAGKGLVPGTSNKELEQEVQVVTVRGNSQLPYQQTGRNS